MADFARALNDAVCQRSPHAMPAELRPDIETFHLTNAVRELAQADAPEGCDSSRGNRTGKGRRCRTVRRSGVSFCERAVRSVERGQKQLAALGSIIPEKSS